MEDCIFCKIVKGEIPAYKVFENEIYLAFLDVAPNVKGHTLLIPKKHYRWVYDVPDFGEYWLTALNITKGMQQAFDTNYVNYYTYGAVPHAHIHILPRTTEIGNGNIMGSSDVVPPHIKIDKSEMQSIANILKDNIK